MRTPECRVPLQCEDWAFSFKSCGGFNATCPEGKDVSEYGAKSIERPFDSQPCADDHSIFAYHVVAACPYAFSVDQYAAQ